MSRKRTSIGRRGLLKGMMGAMAAAPFAGRAAESSGGAPAPAPNTLDRAWMAPAVRGLYRIEMDIHDCEVEGKIPANLSGAFYRVGPDPQYPLAKGNIPFDGEGHVSMFRFQNGRVNYRSRFVRNERYLAQEKAGRALFPMYRNPYLDDPGVKGLSRSTANTHIINYRDLLLAFKEDSPPTALDLLTLETKVSSYTFGNSLPSKTFTAHPKIDSRTGNLVAFGYEAEGHGSDVISMFEYTPKGKLAWSAKVHMPYVCALHDFAVTDNFIAFFLMPLSFDAQQMERGGIHWSWDGRMPSYFGYMRRGGDGKDMRWIQGPTRANFHIMGCFDDGQRLYVELCLSRGQLLPFMPHRDGTSFDAMASLAYVNRISVDTTERNPRDYRMEVLYAHTGTLPRQDDRYHTVPYRYGFMPCPDPADGDPLHRNNCYGRFDHQTKQVRLYKADDATVLAEGCFAPRAANSPEGAGYLMGIATHHDQGGATSLVILDAERPDAGPVATVRMPVPVVGQVHGWWVPEWQMPRQA